MNHDKQYILRKLNITELEYGEYVEQGGYEWLKKYFGHVKDMVELCSISKMFWIWWVNQWEIRDSEFVYQTKFRYDWPVDHQRRIYASFHVIQDLIIIPNRTVIEDVKQLIKKQETKTAV